MVERHKIPLSAIESCKSKELQDFFLFSRLRAQWTVLPIEPLFWFGEKNLVCHLNPKLKYLIFYLEHPKLMCRPAVLLLFSERPPAFDRVSSHVRSCLALRSLVPRPAFAIKYRDWNEKDVSATGICGFGKIKMKGQRRNRRAIGLKTAHRFFWILNTLLFGRWQKSKLRNLFFQHY